MRLFTNTYVQIVGFIVGYLRQDLFMTMQVFAAGCVLSVLVCIICLQAD